MSPSFIVAPASPEELESAFRLLFNHLEAEERTRRVTAALGLIRSGELDPAGVLVARVGHAVRGVLVCQAAAGASSIIWPPSVLDGSARSAIEDDLVRRACAWLRQGGAKLTHALLTDEERRSAGPLERNGVRFVTTLWHLHHNLDNVPPASGRLQYQTCECAESALFRRTLLRTYEGTRDCPELNHVRDVEDTLAGHRAQGRHDPRRWWLALEAGQPVGVLLLADVPVLGGWDLSYLGVVPEARRRGVGRELTHKALAEARRARAPRLSLAVDERNEPARALYCGLGFTPYERRDVLLAVWGTPPHPLTADASARRR